MKRIGLIGGMSWESSIEYYRLINEEVKLRLGGLHSAECLLYSLDFDVIESYMRTNQWDAILEILIGAAKILEDGGAEVIILCTNTMHKLANQVQEEISVELLHIADAAAEEILKTKIDKIGLLGTRPTMEQSFYRTRLEEKGIQVLIPEQEDREIIHNIIFEELCLGTIKQGSRLEYRRIMEQLVSMGANGIVLGCTEIPLLVNEEDSKVPLFDTTHIHARKAVEKALEL